MPPITTLYDVGRSFTPTQDNFHAVVYRFSSAFALSHLVLSVPLQSEPICILSFISASYSHPSYRAPSQGMSMEHSVIASNSSSWQLGRNLIFP